MWVVKVFFLLYTPSSRDGPIIPSIQDFHKSG